MTILEDILEELKAINNSLNILKKLHNRNPPSEDTLKEFLQCSSCASKDKLIADLRLRNDELVNHMRSLTPRDVLKKLYEK